MIAPDQYISFKDWVGSLLIDFSTQDAIPRETDENNWKKWARIVANSPTFVKAGVPEPENFASWQEWGKMLYSRFG